MPFNLRLSLRSRFVGALLIIATLISGGFYYAMDQFIDVLEEELVTQSLMREVNAFTDYHLQNPGVKPPERDGIRTYVYQPGAATTDLPTPMANWSNGRTDEFKWKGGEYQGIRHDIGETRIYMSIDLVRVEDLEVRLVGLAWIFIAGCLFVAAIVGAGLSLLVTRPVSRLARLVTDIDPTDRGIKLGSQFGDHEVGQIAHAFDQYLEKIDQYVEREKAFTDDASHELRTPLSVIISATHLLQEDPQLSERSIERLARIRRAASQMQALIEALLFLAREDGGIANDSCALDEILHERADAFSDQLADKALSIHVDIRAPVTVQAPQAMVLCVVQNLISNAIQNTSKGRIDISLSEHEFVVQDTGTGIPDNALDHIFERRYRGAQSRGLGLGLYIVHRICDRLGWQIIAGNADGAGARFVVKF
ncbi:MAG: HAMP domain-containing sensor histidine kinase [Pseudomonadota bacterium]